MEIKPCPFCGSTQFKITHDLMMPDQMYYSCVECKTDDCCRGGPAAFWFKDKDESETVAIDAWNQRHENNPCEADRWLKEATEQRARADRLEAERDEMAEEKEPEKKNSDYGGSNTPVEIKDLWMTPPEIYAHLNAEFGFSVDLAASGLNKLHENYITAEMNTLGIDWCGMFGRAWGWLNPPYSSIGPFIEKAIEQQERGFGTVMLVPADTSVGWFRLALTSVSEVRFIIGGRISFIRADTNTSVSGNNKGSMLLIFSPHKIGARHFGTVDRDKLMTPL